MTSEPSSDEGDDFVFVYGPLRRGASQTLRMEGAAFIGSGEAAGRLMRITEFPAMVPVDRGHWVVGEVFRVSSEQMSQLDEFHRSQAAAIEDGGFERVRIKVHPQGAPGMIRVAWSWQWTGPVDPRWVIRSGDWLDVEQPRRVPWFTWVAAACLVSLPPGLVSIGAFRYSSDTLIRQAGSVLYICFLLAPMAACAAAVLGERRREGWIFFRGLVFTISALISIATIMELLTTIQRLF